MVLGDLIFRSFEGLGFGSLSHGIWHSISRVTNIKGANLKSLTSAIPRELWSGSKD